MRSIDEPPQPLEAPTAPAIVNRPRRHAQGSENAAGALALRTHQHDGSAQGLASLALAHSFLEVHAFGLG
jgi:hypothetical protein